MAIVFVSIAPLGTATTSLSRYVAGIRAISRSIEGKVRSAAERLRQ